MPPFLLLEKPKINTEFSISFRREFEGAVDTSPIERSRHPSQQGMRQQVALMGEQGGMVRVRMQAALRRLA